MLRKCASAVVTLLWLASSAATAAPDEVAIRLDRARAFQVAGHCDQAEPILAEIATSHPDHPAAGPAASLLFDCLAGRRRTAELARQRERLCAIPQLRRDRAFAETCGKLETALDHMRAEELARVGRHEEAAAMYAALAEKRRDDPLHAELLYNAAVLNARAGLRDLAAEQLRSLVAWDGARVARHVRHHALATTALRLLGDYALATARYAEAAEHYERFAARYGAERDAPDALLTAAMLREALGDDARALEDLHTFVRFYGAESKGVSTWRQIPGLLLAIGAILERRQRPLKVAEHYRYCLETWGGRWGGPILPIVARVKLAEALWRASCAVAGVDGLCVSVAPNPSPCGPRRITVHARKAALAREAQDLLRGVIASSGRGSSDRDLPARSALARARFLVAEAEHERILAADWPERGPDPRQAEELYGQVVAQRDAAWAMAATARLGLLHAAVADRLRARAKGRAACRAAEAAAAPWAARAREAFGVCLAKAGELRWYDDARAACARGLGEQALPDIAPQPGYRAASLPAVGAMVVESQDKSP